MSEERRIGNIKLIEDVAYIRASLDALTGPDGRIKAIEKEAEKQWWVTVALAPLMGIAHAVSRKFGLDV
jgi:hypothetical protein